MLASKIAAPLALLAFIGFFAVIFWKVPRLDLGIVIAIGVLCALYDIWETGRRGARAYRTRTL